MKKIISIVLFCTMLLSCFVGCGAKKGQIALNNDVEMQNLAAAVDWNTIDDWNGTDVTENWYDEEAEVLEIANGADLRAFYVAVRTGNKTFLNQEVKLTANIDLGGKEWAPIVSDNPSDDEDDTNDDNGIFFQGTFNGNNKVIGNFTMTLTDENKDLTTANANPCNVADVVGGHALLGSIGGGATVQDLSVVGGTYILGHTLTTSVVGGIIAEVNTSSGSTVTLSNLYSNCVIKMADPQEGITYATYSICGGVVAKIKGSGNANVSNCTFDGSISINGGNSAGILGNVNSQVQNVNIQSCRNNGALSGTAQMGGIVGNCEVKTSLTVNDCVNAGAITCGDYSGGIIGKVKNVNLTSLTVTNCENLATGTVTTNGGYCGGIIGGVVDARGNTSLTPNSLVALIEDCKNYADVSADNVSAGSGRLAGIIGTFFGKKDSTKTSTIKITIKDCENSGDIYAEVYDEEVAVVYDKNTHCGGIAGYIYGGDNAKNLLAETIIDNCHNTGDVYANRSTGGLIGYIQRSKIVTIQNCTVDANVTVNMVTNSNSHVGGLISRVDLEGGRLTGDARAATKLTIDNCTVKGKVTMIETYSSNAGNKSKAVVGAGLIGTFRFGGMEIKNCTVNTILDTQDISDAEKDILNYFYVSKESTATLTANVGNKYYKCSNEGYEVGSGVTATFANGITPEGAQYRVNNDNTADIRFVFGVTGFNEGVNNALGFDVDIKTIIEDVVTKRETATAYTTYVYETLKGTGANGEELTYTAGEGDYADLKYFVVVTLQGVPQGSYRVEDEIIYLVNAMATVTPFFQEEEDGAKVTYGKQYAHAYTNSTELTDVTATLPGKFEGAQTIVTTIDPLKWNDTENKITNPKNNGDVVAKVTCGGTCEACMTGYALSNADQFAWTGSECTCTDCNLKWSAHGALSYLAAQGVEGMLPHFYLDPDNYRVESGDSSEDTYNYYYSFTFTVAEAGTYDFCFRIRNKGNDGVVNTRYALVQINGQELAQQTKLGHSITISNVTDTNPEGNTNPTLQESYLTGFSAELVAGENTITFRLPYTGGSSMHIRDILIVKQ